MGLGDRAGPVRMRNETREWPRAGVSQVSKACTLALRRPEQTG